MVLSIIVAAAENNVIGRDNGLVWRLSADLKRFKALTTGHTILMGRKTYESVGKALPNRRNIVISRNPDYKAEGCEVVRSVEEALELTKGERLYLTVVHQECEGDTLIPSVDPNQWKEVFREAHEADEKNEFDYTFINYERIK